MIDTAGDMLTRSIRGEYDAASATRRRKAPSSRLAAEDAVLAEHPRRRIIHGGRDLRRNFADAAWAVRKHLDFVSQFQPQARTGDDALDDEIEALIAERSQAQNTDLVGRHPLRRFIRILEASRTIDGDVFALRLPDGRMQAIEGDRVRDPRDAQERAKGTWVHGVRVSRGGRALAYCVHQRARVGRGEWTIVPARYVYAHGYYDRFDQVRGVTPLSSALNAWRDVYEARDYAIAKAKISQLFGVAVTRSSSSSLGDVSGTEPGGYRLDFEKGPVLFDLDDTDDINVLESRTPSSEFREFDRAEIASALKSLDIPLSFYDEAHTNFFGSKGALQQYLFSAAQKRRDNQDLLRSWARWQIALAVADGRLRLPRSIDFDAAARVDWIPVGLPWWKPLEEVKAYIAAIDRGLISTPKAARERGDDVYEILADEKKYRIQLAEANREISEAGGVPIGGEATEGM
jgi:capsid protein